MTPPDALFVFGPDRTPQALSAAARRRLSGLSHGSRMSPRDPGPGEGVTLHIEAGASLPLERVFVSYSTDGAPPTTNSLSLEAEPRTRYWDPLARTYVQTWEARVPGLPEGTRVRYVVMGECGGVLVFADSADGQPVLAGYNVDAISVPLWVREAIVYQIFVDRFWDTSEAFTQPLQSPYQVYGGTLDGITVRLEYLHDLGVTTLWLTPIFPAETYHGYDALDFGSVASRLGGEASLSRLVSAAHGYGIRILLDLAANHCSWHHPFFQHARRYPASPYREWFTFTDWPNAYKTFADVPSLPKLNTHHPDVIAYLTSQASRYLDEIGVDGFRLDHAQGPPLLFWTEFREHMRRTRAGSYLVGEVTQEPDALQWYEGRLDGCLDFPLMAAFRQFFLEHTLDAAAFHGFLTHNERFYGANFTHPSFLDNHDMNRFLWSAGNDTRLLLLAAVAQFTLPQPPIIYYGTETGMSQTEDVAEAGFEAARLPMNWDAPNAQVHSFYRHLIRLRRCHAAMRSPTRHLLSACDRFYAFQACAEGETLVVAINAGPVSSTLSLPGARGRDALSGEEIRDGMQVEPLQSRLVFLERD